MTIAKDWNPKQKELNLLLSKSHTFSKGITLCLSMHSELHDINNNTLTNMYQELLTDLTQEQSVWRPAHRYSSIAWNLYHITRIEDAVSSLLIEGKSQTFSRAWQKKMGITFTDTGNAWSEEELDSFNSTIKLESLLEYRKKVGMRSQSIIASLSEKDRVRKPDNSQVKRILSERVVTEQKDSLWLMDFWGNKTIAGLLSMPMTRHQTVHIHDSYTLKNTWIKQKGKYEKNTRN